MATKRKSGKSRKTQQRYLGKPNGVIQPRVEEVGPEHFGIVAIDCAKARAKWMFCNFYGKVLVEPTRLSIGKGPLQLAVLQVQQACEEHDIRDQIVAVEMTGTYHRPVQRAFRKAGFETRLVHPFASNHYRCPAHGDIKTDDNDLVAIFRAAVNGFGLLELSVGEVYGKLQLLARHRRDLVKKRSTLQCQIREFLGRCLPGYGALFPEDSLWQSHIAVPLVREYSNADAIRAAGVSALVKQFRERRIHFQARTIEKIVSWAGQAAAADPLAPVLQRIWCALDDDRLAKCRQIQEIERDLVDLFVLTPYVLLLTMPGINVISGSEMAGEMGPITHYAHARAITGRAGLFPRRYQSDEVDRTGPLARFRNHKLRAIWMLVAENLLRCNAYFRGKGRLWRDQDVDPRDIHTRIANRATRVVFQIVSGGQVFQHPCGLNRDYLMEKLTDYCREHHIPPDHTLRLLHAAADQIPKAARADEAACVKTKFQQTRRNSRKEPESLGTLLVAVLAKLGAVELQSNESEARGSD